MRPADSTSDDARWIRGVTPDDDARLAAEGFVPARDVLQLRRSLPVEGAEERAGQLAGVRPFEPGRDDEAWLRVNNRAFDWHPDQGGWSLDDLHRRLSEPWVDLDGFLVHEAGGELDAFVWTKVHDEVDPPLGEIFVIAVDPSAHGRGLGRAIVLAGLDSLAGRGLQHGMLYTEATNEPALALYEHLGFEVHSIDRLYERRP